MTQSKSGAGFSVGRRVKVIKPESSWFGQTGLIGELQDNAAIVRIGMATQSFQLAELFVLGAS